MNGFLDLPLIHFLDFYFTFVFLAGTARRIGQYHNIVKLALTGPGRWPRLLQLVREHRTIFMTWATVAPALLALALSVLQLIASRLIWPEAGHSAGGLTIGSLAHHRLALCFIMPLGLGMLGLDLYTLLRVAEIPRTEIEKYFDQAEYWLGSHTAHVVRIFTLGFINPRKLVATEVRKALVSAGDLLNTTLWWVNLQIGLRVCFGLSLWLTWALDQ